MDILNAGSDKISLMLLDLLMPVMDGFEVLASMNRSHMLENLPVIMISSEDSDAFIRRAYEQGVSDYISRPFDAKVVYRRVYNTIKLYAKQRRLVSMVTSQILEKEKNNMLLINILSHVVEFRNGQNGSHVQHMRQLSERILETLCAKTDRYRLTPAGLRPDCPCVCSMHDIGKIAIDAKILNKPGKLTPEEFDADEAAHGSWRERGSTTLRRTTTRSWCARPATFAAGTTSAMMGTAIPTVWWG